jgi:hypothetical protein
VPGHAKAVTSSAEGAGAIIGKALTPLEHACGMVDMLISLQ